MSYRTRHAGLKRRVLNVLVWSAPLLLTFSIISEVVSGTFSTLWAYALTEVDASTQGRITRSDVVRPGKINHPGSYRIRYFYVVDGVAYSGARVDFHALDHHAAELVRRFPVGSEVSVRYDSRRPARAVLLPGPVGAEVWWRLALIAAGSLLCGVLAGAFNRPVRRMM